MATVAALRTYEGLRPGETPTILCLAVDKQQARIILRYIRAYFEEIELLQGLVERETQDGFELSNGAEILVLSNNYRSVRGRTIVFCCFDECAFWRDEFERQPGRRDIQRRPPRHGDNPDAMLVGITTVHRRDGLVYNKCRESYGKNDDRVLFIKATSRQLNPTIDQAIIDAAMARDPAAARAEYFSEWRDDLARSCRVS